LISDVLGTKIALVATFTDARDAALTTATVDDASRQLDRVRSNGAIDRCAKVFRVFGADAINPTGAVIILPAGGKIACALSTLDTTSRERSKSVRLKANSKLRHIIKKACV